MDPMGAGQLSDRSTLPQVRLDQVAALFHRRPPVRCRLCLDTSVAYVLVSDTSAPTTFLVSDTPAPTTTLRGLLRVGDASCAGTRKRVDRSPPSCDPACRSPQRAESARAGVYRLPELFDRSIESDEMLPAHVPIAVVLAGVRYTPSDPVPA